MEYAITQRAWSKNPCNCLRRILKDTSTAATPAKDVMVPFWKNILTCKSDQSPGVLHRVRPEEMLWVPIELTEIKGSFPEMNTSPGPDGLTARQLRAVPLDILVRIFNLFMLCGKLPKHLLESRTTLIPKKDGASNPGDFRPITVSSVLARTFHKILAKRLIKLVDLDQRQKAFIPVDGCAENIFLLDLILRYHRQNFKSLYIASIDVSKAFDSVSHIAIKDTLRSKGLPPPMESYIMDVYSRSTTRLVCDGWISDPIKPTCGVKQGDPLSPIIFNLVIDGLLRQIPPEVGVDIDGNHYNAFAFADDLVFVASTQQGLQMILDIATNYLAKCGLSINATKSFTVAIRNVPHLKKSVVDSKIQFNCSNQKMPALKRQDEWRYLGVSFTPEGRSLGTEVEQLNQALSKLAKAPLKPQQRLFGLRVMVLPSLYHLLTLGNTTLSRLKKIDALIRGAVRKWLDLPHDVPNAYVHANVKDGGLSIPSMRWLMPFQRMRRLNKLANSQLEMSSYLMQEINRAKKRLRDGRDDLDSTEKLEQRWAKILHSSVDGRGLSNSRDVPQQHQWVVDGNRFLSGRDFINAAKFRINAMPTKSRTARGRTADRHCRAGCNAIETLHHVLQNCQRTHKVRIERHNAITAYIKRGLEKTHEMVDEEPHFMTSAGLRKPDLVAKKGEVAIVIDAQVVGEHFDLQKAHERKVEYYKPLSEAIKTKYGVRQVKFTSATLSYRGIWSKTSAQMLLDERILMKKELKIVSTRVLVGGLSGFWRFNRTTTRTRKQNTPRTGIG